MKTALVWFRRDLRQHDHSALAAALEQAERVVCLFVFDPANLTPLPNPCRALDFMLASLAELDAGLRAAGGGLVLRHGDPALEVPRAAQAFGCDAVFANEDYEPMATARDAAVQAGLFSAGIAWHSFKDQVVLARAEVLTQAGKPFTVFTPFQRAWLARVREADLTERSVSARPGQWVASDSQLPSAADLGFGTSNLGELPISPGATGGARTWADFQTRIDAYRDARDYPALRGPSYLSVHLRFGTVSVRELARTALKRWRETESPGAQTWLSELIWREFYQQLLWHHPHVVERSFKPAYDALVWDEAPDLWAAWTEGATGYPLVDAAIAQIRSSGYMHNRLRMVVASFLTKDLGIAWQRGADWFAEHLIDHDLAANNGGWQWAASTGCDAQPWFRIFNPVTQSQRFDPEGRFIRRYLPQLAGFSVKEIHAPWLVPAARQREAGCVIGRDYPAPVVDHAAARERTLARFGAIRSGEDA